MPEKMLEGAENSKEQGKLRYGVKVSCIIQQLRALLNLEDNIEQTWSGY
jgi:hypothetical protein